MSDETSAKLPLSGIRVVEIGTSVAAPYAAWILANMGADVIKAERPGKGDDARHWGRMFEDGSSSYFQALNYNKRGITVDFADEQECAWFADFLANEVDVVIQNMRYGVVGKYGLDAETLRKKNPRLIYCNMGAFGRSGPLKDRPGYDPLMQAYGGIMGITGEDGRPPIRVGVSIVDMGTGMWSALGILGAVRQRDLTGEGCVVDTSLYETAVAWMTNSVASAAVDGRNPERQGSGARGLAPYQAYACADGHLVIAAPSDALFEKLAGVLGHPEWPADPRFNSNPNRYANLSELNELIEPIIATKPRQHWQTVLQDAGVPNAPVQQVLEMLADPQTQALGILQTLGNGPQLMGMPLSFDGYRPPLERYAPTLGEHNDEIKNGTDNGNG